MLRVASLRTDGVMNQYNRVSLLETALFNPTQIPGLQVWLSASQLALNNDDPVQTWPDISGNNNHATQATLANRPLFKTNVTFGKPVVRFDGSNDYMQFTNNINVGPGTMFVIGNKTAGSNYRIFCVTGKFGMYASGGVSTHWITYLPGDLESNVTTNSTHRLMTTVVSSGTTAKMWTNNGTIVTRTGGLGYTSVASSLIGGSSGGTQNLTGDIAEVLVYDTALSDANVALVNTYLMTRYGLT